MKAKISKCIVLWLASVVVFGVRSADAAIPVIGVPLPGGFLGVQYFAGSGPDTAYIVVDFSGDPIPGNPNGTYAFGYHWDPAQITPTTADALYSISTAKQFGSLGVVVEPAFTSSGADPSANYFLDELQYGADDDNPDVNKISWFYFVGKYASQSVTWKAPENYGISDIDYSCGTPVIHTLKNGVFNGFRVDTFEPPDYDPNSGSPVLPVTTLEKGDFNLDGHVDAGDVVSMEKALADLSAYQNGDNSQQATLTESDLLAIGDLNGDGKITNADLQDLLNLLKSGQGSVENVPEPAAWVLASCAAMCMLAFWRRGYVRR
jgi:hypothetical protein